MQVILTICAVAWMVMGGAIFGTAKSAIHEILACLLVSFGVMFLGLGAIVARLDPPRTPDAKQETLEA
jgi:hypothetical protein